VCAHTTSAGCSARVFRRPTGVPHEFLNQLDVRAAVERIRDGHHDLARLASELGSSGHGHLSANSAVRSASLPGW
jgi:hypothetical protein